MRNLRQMIMNKKTEDDINLGLENENLKRKIRNLENIIDELQNEVLKKGQ